MTTVSALPLVGRTKQPQNDRELYLIPLKNVVNHNKPSLFCSDLTSNPRVASEHPPLVYRGGYTVPNEQLLFVSVFEDKWRAIGQQYERVTGRRWPLPRSEFSFQHLVVLRVRLRLHSYNGRTEGTLAAFELVQEDSATDEHLDGLFTRVFDKFPDTFFEGSEKLVPAKYKASLRAKMGNIKRETIVERSNMVPDTLVSDCYMSDSENSLDGIEKRSQTENSHTEKQDSQTENSHTHTERQAHTHTENGHTAEHISPEHLTSCHAQPNHPVSLTDLSVFSSHPPGRLFRVNGFLVGSVPRDWTYLCTKPLVENNWGDPEPHELELVLSCASPTLLTSENSLRVRVSADNIVDFFGFTLVEQLYTGLAAFQKRWQAQEVRRVCLDVYGEGGEWYIHNGRVGDVLG